MCCLKVPKHVSNLQCNIAYFRRRAQLCWEIALHTPLGLEGRCPFSFRSSKPSLHKIPRPSVRPKIVQNNLTFQNKILEFLGRGCFSAGKSTESLEKRPESGGKSGSSENRSLFRAYLALVFLNHSAGANLERRSAPFQHWGCLKSSLPFIGRARSEGSTEHAHEKSP